jgi:hypothetical protein
LAIRFDAPDTAAVSKISHKNIAVRHQCDAVGHKVIGRADRFDKPALSIRLNDVIAAPAIGAEQIAGFRCKHAFRALHALANGRDIVECKLKHQSTPMSGRVARGGEAWFESGWPFSNQALPIS